MLPKLIITDIDGVWTNGGMYYDNLHAEFKQFNTYDSAGVLFCQLLEIPVAIITGENSPIVKRRADKLHIEHVFLGVKNKWACADELRKELHLEWRDIAYIGDDINDIPLLKAVGFSASPANAPTYIQDLVHVVTQKKGGEGAFREFVEHMLQKNQKLEWVLELYLSKI